MNPKGYDGRWFRLNNIWHYTRLNQDSYAQALAAVAGSAA